MKYLAKVIYWILIPLNLIRFTIDILWTIINYTIVWVNSRLIGLGWDEWVKEGWQFNQCYNSKAFMEWFYEQDEED